MPTPKDLTGQTFGRLTVVRQDKLHTFPSGRTVQRWLCRCSCGKEKSIIEGSLLTGNSRSCGCLQREAVSGQTPTNKTHGRAGTPEYCTWVRMKGRCENPNIPMFYRYGGRGIKVCERWRQSFEAFFADLGPKPTPEHTLGRIDNDGDYEPGNVRWETAMQQGANSSRTHSVTINGETKHVAEWCRLYGVSTGLFQQRVGLGWSEQDAITTPVRNTRGKLMHNGKLMSLADIARVEGVGYHALHSRLKRGQSLEEALAALTAK